MKHKVERRQFITREYVRANRDKLFLFGDNLERRGFGGQAAAMRREPNAIGIPTKKSPSYRDDAFFSDEEFEQNKASIDAAFAEIMNAVTDSIRVIVIPSDGPWYRPGAARETCASYLRPPAEAPDRDRLRIATP